MLAEAPCIAEGWPVIGQAAQELAALVAWEGFAPLRDIQGLNVGRDNRGWRVFLGSAATFSDEQIAQLGNLGWSVVRVRPDQHTQGRIAELVWSPLPRVEVAFHLFEASWPRCAELLGVAPGIEWHLTPRCSECGRDEDDCWRTGCRAFPGNADTELATDAGEEDRHAG